MTDLAIVAREFLDNRRIAVAGVSRNGKEAANVIFDKLKETGHEVFAVNPAAKTVEGVPAYPDLASIPGGVDAVVISTPPTAAPELVRQCAELGIEWVWLHRAFGHGSFDEYAVRLGQEAGMTVIPGGCPMMFLEPVDPAHRCMRWLLRFTGAVPREVEEPIAA